MKQYYRDIMDRIPEPPIWYDMDGVPRYCEMDPGYVSNIYADEVLFFEIACQECGTRYNVVKYTDKFSRYESYLKYTWGKPNYPYNEREFSIEHKLWKLEEQISYGDPPCRVCCSGATMSSETVRGLSFWKRHPFTSWKQIPLEDFKKKKKLKEKRIEEEKDV
jgi:hypothetical protein